MNRLPAIRYKGTGDLKRILRKTPRREHPRQCRARRIGCGRSRRLPFQCPAKHSLRPFQAAKPRAGDTHIVQDAGIVGSDVQRLFEQGCRRRLVAILQQVRRHLVQQTGVSGMPPDQIRSHARCVRRPAGPAQRPAEQKRRTAIVRIEFERCFERFRRFGRSTRHGVAKPMQIGQGRIIRSPGAAMANQPVRRRRIARQQERSGAVEKLRGADTVQTSHSFLNSAGHTLPVSLHIEATGGEKQSGILSKNTISHSLYITWQYAASQTAATASRPWSDIHPPCEHCEEEQHRRCWRPAPRTIC